MSCCSDLDTIFADSYEDGTPLAARYVVTGRFGENATLSYPDIVPGVGDRGSIGLRSTSFPWGNPIDGQNELSALLPSIKDICENDRLAFGMGGWFYFPAILIHDHFLFEVRNSYLATETLLSVHRGSPSNEDTTDIYVNSFDLGPEVFRVRNVAPSDTWLYIEIRGAVNSGGHADGGINVGGSGGSIELRVDGVVYGNGEDANDTHRTDPKPTDRCKTTDITFVPWDDGAGDTSQAGAGGIGWDKATIGVRGAFDCFYLKEIAAYCSLPAPTTTTSPSPGPCPPAGPAGSNPVVQPSQTNVDPPAQPPRQIPPGGAVPPPPVSPPAGGGTPAPSTPITGATFYVSTTGSDARTPTQAQSISTPWRTINHALPYISANNQLLVLAGNYPEAIINNVLSGTAWGNKVRIAANPGDTVWLDPQAGNWVLNLGTNGQSPAYIELDGINMNGANRTDATIKIDDQGGGHPHHIRIQNAEIHGREGAGQTNAAVTVGGSGGHEFINLTVHGTGGPYGFYLGTNNSLVDGCEIYHTSLAGIQIYKSGGTPTGNIIRNCIIRDITSSYFFGAPDPRLWGIIVAGANNQIYNNVIYGLNLTYQSGNSAIRIYQGSGHQIFNNTLYDNATEGISNVSTGSGIEIRNNIAYLQAHTAFTYGTASQSNNQSTDPSFVNAGAANFRLQAGSSARDTGTDLSAYFTTDFDGITRPQGAAWDRGAFEYH